MWLMGKRASGILTPKQVAAHLDLHINTVWKVIQSGDLRATKTSEGGTWLIHHSAVDNWIGLPEGTTLKEIAER